MFLVSSCSCLCSIQWSQVLSPEWRCSWSSADRRCSNYVTHETPLASSNWNKYCWLNVVILFMKYTGTDQNHDADFTYDSPPPTCLSSRMLYPSDTRQALNSLGSRRRLRVLSKWKKDLRNSSICSLVMPFESRVRIWFSISLMLRATDVRSCSHPTRSVCK